MRIWTDYPDTIMRRGSAIDFDGNKYVTVLIDGETQPVEIKYGYCYRSRRKVFIRADTFDRRLNA